MSDKEQLYYHKCNDCLTPFSSTYKKVDLCDCGGDITFMGQVHGDKFVKTENRPPCDGRCTHACGPTCDCACGGANHGTGKLVSVVVHEGKIKANGLSVEDLLRAQKYRTLRDYAENQFKEIFATTLQQMAENHRVQYSEYRHMKSTRQELDNILSLRVYEKRQNKLLEFVVKQNKLKNSNTE